MPRLSDDVLLQASQRGVAHLDAEIAARHHQRVRGINDTRELRDRLVPFDLGDDAHVAATGFAQQPTRKMDVICIADERQCHVVGALRRDEVDVLAVLVGERRRRDAAALSVHTFAVREFAADGDAGADAAAPHLEHLKHEQPIIEQQSIAGDDVDSQFLVGHADRIDCARGRVECGVERELGTLDELHPTFNEALDADLGAGEIEQSAHAATRARRGLTQLAQAEQVVGLGAVGEVDAGDIETGTAHLEKDIIIVGSRPEGGYDLGTALHGTIVGPEAAALNLLAR